MFLSGRNGDGVADSNRPGFPSDPHSPLARGDEVNLLGPDVVMLLGARTDGDARLRETLASNRGIPMGQQFPDFRTVFCDKRRRFVQVLHIHKMLKIRLFIAPRRTHDKQFLLTRPR